MYNWWASYITVFLASDENRFCGPLKKSSRLTKPMASKLYLPLTTCATIITHCGWEPPVSGPFKRVLKAPLPHYSSCRPASIKKVHSRLGNTPSIQTYQLQAVYLLERVSPWWRQLTSLKHKEADTVCTCSVGRIRHKQPVCYIVNIFWHIKRG